MDAPPDKEDCRPFVHVAGLIGAAGLHAPRVLECDAAQGFYFSKPVDAIEAGALIALANSTSSGAQPPVTSEEAPALAPRVH